MPYFTRQPYAAPIPVPQAAAAPDIMALADQVLALDTGRGTVAPFRLRTPLRPGETGEMVLSFAADPGPALPPLPLAVGDLTGPAGRIPAARLRLDPPLLQIAPGGSAEVRITVQAPEGTAPGLYAGTLSAPGPDGFAARIEVPVTA